MFEDPGREYRMAARKKLMQVRKMVQGTKDLVERKNVMAEKLGSETSVLFKQAMIDMVKWCSAVNEFKKK